MDEEIQQLLSLRRYTEAFEHLLDKYETKVFRMAFTYLQDRALAEETTQDIFVKLWQALPRYDGRAAPGTWLYAIARNTCLSASRFESYRKTVPIDACNEPRADPVPRPTETDVARCIQRLPETQRLAITLFYLEDKRVDEVARMLGLPEGTVKSHLHRARIALAGMMKENE
jgi:RNA polymerase sigma-70 factor (ECF subfamily)